MRALILALALAGCTTPVVDRPVPHAHHTVGHEAPSMAEIAAQTSLRREAMKSAEIAYGAALVAATLALNRKRLSQQDRDEMPSAEARASDAMDYFRTLMTADESMFVAALFYVNFSNNELLKLAEGDRDEPDPWGCVTHPGGSLPRCLETGKAR